MPRERRFERILLLVQLKLDGMEDRLEWPPLIVVNGEFGDEGIIGITRPGNASHGIRRGAKEEEAIVS